MDDLRRALDDRMRALIPDQVTIGQVKSVDETALTCLVLLLPDEGLELPGVRLVPAIGEDALSLVVFPEVDSMVLVGVINNNLLSSYVISCQTAAKIVMMGGDLGGMVKVDELRSQLAKLTLRVDKCVEFIKKAQTASLHPSPTWATEAIAAFDPLVKEDFKNIENERVSHG
jgi:hypothetical protein